MASPLKPEGVSIFDLPSGQVMYLLLYYFFFFFFVERWIIPDTVHGFLQVHSLSRAHGVRVVTVRQECVNAMIIFRRKKASTAAIPFDVSFEYTR